MMYLTAILVATTFWTAQPTTWTGSFHCQPLSQIPVHVVEQGVWVDPATGEETRVLGRLIPHITQQDPVPAGWCEVQIDPGRWNWWRLCDTVQHEFGHATGRGHSEDPRDFMYKYAHNFRERPSICIGARPPSIPRGTTIRLQEDPKPYEIPK